MSLLRLCGQGPHLSFCRIGGQDQKKWQRPFLESSLPAVFFFRRCKKKQKHPWGPEVSAACGGESEPEAQ